MAKSAAVKIEVRWRETGTEQWSDIQSCAPSAQIVIEGLNRTKTYDFEWRGVSACGARSAWGSTPHALPDVAAGNITLADLKTEADTAAADALAANQELANIASDNILSQGEKPVVIRDYSVITSEQGGIDAQATAFAITTTKTAYDSAVTALTSYLGTLTTPTAWNSLSGDTTIVGTTFRQKFADVYTTRQALLNAIYAAAKAKADAAQSTADAAQNSAPIINPNFGTGNLNGWTSDYGTWAFQSGTAGPETGTSTYAIRTGSSGTPTDTLRNLGKVPVYAGAVIKAACSIRAAGANGTCATLISWRNAAGAEISVTQGNTVTGTTLAASFAVGAAPAGAVLAHIEAAAIGHTTGTYAVDGFIAPILPDTLDQVPDGFTKFGAVLNPARQNGVYAPGQNMVVNPCFALRYSGAGYPGWSISGGSWSNGSTGLYGQAYFATFAENVCSTGTAFTSVLTSDEMPVVPAQVYSVQVAYAVDRSYSSGDASADIQWYTSSHTLIGGSTRLMNQTVATSGAVVAKLENISPPGTAAYARIRLFVENVAETGGAVYFRVSRVKMEIGAVCTPYQDDGTQGGNKLTVAGSGQVIGNQLNAPNSLTLNYGAVRTATAVTATSSGAVSINAFAVNMGGTAVSYSAVSNAVTGLAVGSTYQIYCRDSGPIASRGGTKTWYAYLGDATGLLTLGDDVVLAGQVTIPSSGSSGGGGSGAGCPDENAWVLCADPRGARSDWVVRAGTVQPGHHLRLTDGRTGLVTHSQRKAAGRVRVVDDRGKALTCSRTAPLELFDGAGECVMAPKCAGQTIKARADGVPFGTLVWKVEDTGPGYVQHITCQNACFWAGDEPDYLFGHHNLKP